MNSPLKMLPRLLVIIPSIFTGCADVALHTPRLVFDEPPAEVPGKLIPVWTDTILHTDGEKPTRGFGGRLMFYGSDETTAIEVDGSLIVYAWDDTESKLLQAPDRKYVFSAEKLSSHCSESKVGDSYSFWIPWDSVGQPMQKVMLICRFIARGGGEITSTPAHVVLQGPMAPPSVESSDRSSNGSGIQLTSHEMPAEQDTIKDEPASETETIESTTIHLPPGFLERNASGTMNESSDDSTSGTVQNPLTATNGSAWRAETVEPGQSREAGSRFLPRRARTKPVAQRLADRARSQPRRSEWRSDSSRLPESVQAGGYSFGHAELPNAATSN